MIITQYINSMLKKYYSLSHLHSNCFDLLKGCRLYCNVHLIHFLIQFRLILWPFFFSNHHYLYLSTVCTVHQRHFAEELLPLLFFMSFTALMMNLLTAIATFFQFYLFGFFCFTYHHLLLPGQSCFVAKFITRSYFTFVVNRLFIVKVGHAIGIGPVEIQMQPRLAIIRFQII